MTRPPLISRPPSLVIIIDSSIKLTFRLHAQDTVKVDAYIYSLIKRYATALIEVVKAIAFRRIQEDLHIFY